MNISDQFFKVGIFLADKRLARPVKFNDIFSGAICFYQNEFKKKFFRQKLFNRGIYFEKAGRAVCAFD